MKLDIKVIHIWKEYFVQLQVYVDNENLKCDVNIKKKKG